MITDSYPKRTFAAQASRYRREALTYTFGAGGDPKSVLRERLAAARVDPELTGRLRDAVIERLEELLHDR